MPPQEHTTEQQDTERTVSPSRVEPRVIRQYDGELVIAGLSGRYPESDNVTEFKENLLNKVNMVTVDNRRWEPGYWNLPPYMGKIKDLTKFDAEFFGIHSKAAESTDPQLRLLLEVAYEAIVDAGESLTSMKGTRTGVYIGVTGSEAEHAWMGRSNEYVITGVPHTIIPNRISFFFDLRGPSCAYDTACSTSIVTMEAACLHMRSGVIDQAIVGAVNLIMRPHTTHAFTGMNMLGSGACRAFDAAGDGFVRADTISACLLKKAADAKRIYCTVEACLTNNDGWSNNGLTYPNSFAQEELMRDLYTNYNIDASQVKYFECHGTGTPAGDPNETRAVCSVMCENRSGPLLIGSTKSNMGHSEVSSGFSSLTKVIIGMHTRLIPPNLHFETPNPDIPGLFDGRLKVVTEPTRWDGGLVAMNSFGMGGSNGHIVLRSYDGKRTEPHPASEKPRLFVYSARTEGGLKNILEEAHKHASDVEFQALCQLSANAPLGSMPYRGATLLNAEKEITEIQKVSSKPRELWFVYSGMGSQWVGMGQSLMALDVFRASVQECSDALKPFGVDLLDLLLNCTEDKLKTIVAPFVCIAAIQIALTDILFSMGIKPDGIVGHSLGEGSCAYADGCHTRRETMLSAYFRGQSVVDSRVAPGKMAAVGLTWEEAQAQCPPGVVAACHNAEDSVTISGGAQEMTQFIGDLQARGVFVKEVNSNNVSYHSHFMEPVSVKLKASLDKHLTSNKPRSSKWVSTSIPEHLWDTPVAQYAKGDYQANNLRSPVLFYEGLQKVPKNALIVEVAPVGLLQSVIKRTVGPDCISIELQKRKHENNLEFFFSALGKCFSHGVSMDPLKVYPPVEFPVSWDTPMISSMVSQAWDHSIDWIVPKVEDFETGSGSSSADTSYEIDVSEDSPDRYLIDHQVDGRPLFPACGSLVLAWQTLAKIKGLDFQQMPVRLSNVQIKQAMFLPTSGSATVTVSVMPKTGEFQICENENILACGVVTSPEGPCLETDQYLKTESVLVNKPVTEVLTKDEVYRELIARGYEYGHYFQGVQRSGVEGLDSDILWDGRWISYLDAVLQMILLGNPDAFQALPLMLETVNIDPTVHPAPPQDEEVANTIPGHYDKVLGIVAAGGVEIRGIHTIRVSRRLTHEPPTIGDFCFQPYRDVLDGDRTAPRVPQILKDYADACWELSRLVTKRWLEQDKDNVMPNRECLSRCVDYQNKTMNKPISSSSYSTATACLESIIKQKNGHPIPDSGFHGFLLKAYNEPYSKDFVDIFRPMMHDERFEIGDDPVLASLETEDITKLVFDTVADNVASNVVNILEAGAIKSMYFRQAIPKALDHFTFKNFRYFVADKYIVEDALQYPIKMLMFDTNDPWTFPDAQRDSYDLLILKNHLHSHKNLDLAFTAYSEMVKPGGFVLVTEQVERLGMIYAFESLVIPSMCEGEAGPEGERILGSYYTESQWRAFFTRHGFEEIIHRADGITSATFLLRKRLDTMTPPRIIHVDDLQYSWLEEVKARFEELQSEPEDARLWLVATSENSGIWGMVQCLRWEAGSEKLRCVHVSNRKSGSAMPKLTENSPEFEELIRKDLVNNVFRDGRWGTYRFLMMSEESRQKKSPKQNVFADCYVANDPLSLTWFDSPISLRVQSNELATLQAQNTDMETCSVYFAGLSQRDVFLANGSVKKDDLPEAFFHKEGVLGVEFSGKDSSGRNVIGLCAPPALASSVQCPKSSLWSVPNHWSLEEAATVPLAYATAFHALLTTARIKRGEKVFVQSGWTSIGQASIAVALSKGCEVFTLTRNSEDVSLLKTRFPQLKDKHIHNSTDLAYQRRILVETRGKGVDVVLNFQNDSALKARLGLLAKGSRFLDISFGVDDSAHRAFSVGAWKTSTFYKVQLDTVLADQSGDDWAQLSALVQSGLQTGVVKPLKRQVYPMHQLVSAFKAADGETSSGKVLIQIRDEERGTTGKGTKTDFPGVYCTWFYPSKCYVLVGGLGGLGLELSDWMIRRGARKLVLTSRSGITTGYQAKKVAYLRQLGAVVEILPITVNSLERVNSLVKFSTRLGPIGGLFNLGMNLVDKPFLEQTVDTFLAATDVKINTTMLLDQVSREEPIRASLDYFVMFSSVVAYHGHVGQSNYGFGNSVAERICERRRFDGFPGLAVQWGPVGDVGFVGKMGNSVVICEKLPQRLQSVKATFDFMLSQTSACVVSSYVPNDRSSGDDSGEETLTQKMAKAVAKVLGVKDVTAVDGDKEFIELGLDSLMSVEIKQILERDLDLFISTKEIQLMTFNSLKTLVEG